MTDEELKLRAEMYRQLLEYEPYRFLVKEMERDIEGLKEAITNDWVNDRLVDKGIISGIRKVIYTPIDAIKQENSEPS